MTPHQILLVVSLILFILAAFMTSARVNIGWLAMAFFVAAFLVP